MLCLVVPPRKRGGALVPPATVPSEGSSGVALIFIGWLDVCWIASPREGRTILICRLDDLICLHALETANVDCFACLFLPPFGGGLDNTLPPSRWKQLSGADFDWLF